jgi:hypothetical protein
VSKLIDAADALDELANYIRLDSGHPGFTRLMQVRELLILTDFRIQELEDEIADLRKSLQP